jgi:predicted GNAT family acetyltransferase
MDVEVADNPDKARFEIVADGELAGFVQYHLRGDEIAFTHTETDDRFRGHGLASQLVRAALDAARVRQLAVLPYCPFVRSWLDQHPEYADLVPAGRREQFGL